MAQHRNWRPARTQYEILIATFRTECGVFEEVHASVGVGDEDDVIRLSRTRAMFIDEQRGEPWYDYTESAFNEWLQEQDLLQEEQDADCAHIAFADGQLVPRTFGLPESADACEFGQEEYDWRLRQAGL